MLLGSHLRCSDHALVFSRFPFGPGGAITFGNVILNTAKDLDAVVTTYQCRTDGNRNDCIHIGNHERAHVYQQMAVGKHVARVMALSDPGNLPCRGQRTGSLVFFHEHDYFMGSNPGSDKAMTQAMLLIIICEMAIKVEPSFLPAN